MLGMVVRIMRGLAKRPETTLIQGRPIHIGQLLSTTILAAEVVPPREAGGYVVPVVH